MWIIMILTNQLNTKIKSYIKNTPRPLICIVWPTACWKTALAVEIAKLFNWELINSDSRQVYQDIECITWLDYEEIADVANHLFWFKQLDQEFTVAEYLDLVRDIIEKVYKINKIPIIVWWTWLFISSLIEWFVIPPRQEDDHYIESLKHVTNEDLLLELKKFDPESASMIHVNNRIYLERALEVFHVSWLKKSSWLKDGLKSFNSLIITKKIEGDSDRENLYNRINKRQEFFFELSLPIIREILEKDLSPELQSLRSIWIPEIRSFLLWEITKDEAILLMQKKARNYAKRQMTWWRPKKNKFNIIEI